MFSIINATRQNDRVRWLAQTTIVPANTMELISKPGTKAQIWENFSLKKANDESGINDGNVYCRVSKESCCKKRKHFEPLFTSLS